MGRCPRTHPDGPGSAIPDADRDDGGSQSGDGQSTALARFHRLKQAAAVGTTVMVPLGVVSATVAVIVPAGTICAVPTERPAYSAPMVTDGPNSIPVSAVMLTFPPAIIGPSRATVPAERMTSVATSSAPELARTKVDAGSEKKRLWTCTVPKMVMVSAAVKSISASSAVSGTTPPCQLLRSDQSPPVVLIQEMVDRTWSSCWLKGL